MRSPTGVTEGRATELLELLDWKRTVFELYASIRASSDPEAAWHRWREVRDELFRSHPQSPVPARERPPYPGARYYDYDPAVRVLAEVRRSEPTSRAIDTSRDGTIAFTRFGAALFELAGQPRSLDLSWLDGYGGGLFLSFTDATSGTETYGGARYVLDTVKGADLGMEGDRLILDFNFAYNPSCAYDPTWVCPLAPPENRLPVPIRAGERMP